MRLFQNLDWCGGQGQQRSGWPCHHGSGPSRWSDPATPERGFETASWRRSFREGGRSVARVVNLVGRGNKTFGGTTKSRPFAIAISVSARAYYRRWAADELIPSVPRSGACHASDSALS